jgi:hypothetical protein
MKNYLVLVAVLGACYMSLQAQNQLRVGEITPDPTVGARTFVAKPALATSSFTYDGNAKTVMLNPENADAYAIVSGASATDADTYFAVVALKNKDAYIWLDGDTARFSLSWSIAQAKAPAAPAGLTAITGQTLADIDISSFIGWSWYETTSTSVGASGSNTFHMNYAGDANHEAATNAAVTVTVQSNDTTLATLSVSPGILSPEFAASTAAYTVDVGNDITSITISATANEAHAAVTGTGTKTLDIGANPFSIVVTAETGATKTYTVTVTRADTGTGLPGIDDDPIVETQYYSPVGTHSIRPARSGVYIVKEIHRSGKVSTKKIILK